MLFSIFSVHRRLYAAMVLLTAAYGCGLNPGSKPADAVVAVDTIANAVGRLSSNAKAVALADLGQQGFALLARRLLAKGSLDEPLTIGTTSFAGLRDKLSLALPKLEALDQQLAAAEVPPNIASSWDAWGEDEVPTASELATALQHFSSPQASTPSLGLVRRNSLGEGCLIVACLPVSACTGAAVVVAGTAVVAIALPVVTVGAPILAGIAAARSLKAKNLRKEAASSNLDAIQKMNAARASANPECKQLQYTDGQVMLRSALPAPGVPTEASDELAAAGLTNLVEGGAE